MSKYSFDQTPQVGTVQTFEQYVTVNNCDIFVKKLGISNHKLLVIHGGPDWDHNYLLPAFTELVKEFEVILFDLRGCGKSQKFDNSSHYSLDNVVQDIYALINKLDLDTCSLLGFSFGGSVALQFFSTYPERVEKLVLASTTIYSDFQSDLDQWDEYRKRCTPNLKALKKHLFESEMDTAFASQKLALETLSLDIYELEKLPFARDTVKAVKFSGEWLQALRDGQLAKRRKFDHILDLNQHKIPLLILHGEKDMRFPISVAKRLKENVPNAQLAIVMNAGHFIYIDQPAEWTYRLKTFL